jgi:two-component system cell cycle response regulator
MTTTQNSILEKLKISGRLPTPKGIALEVINLTKQEDIFSHEIVRLISADPALCLRVIKAANVLVGNPSRPVVTINDAVTILGFRALRQLVLGIALIADYQQGPCKQFNYSYFWAHSLLSGIAVRHLAARSRLAAAEEIFTLGLLGGIGRLALATVYPAEFGAILEHAGQVTLDELYSKEREKFGFEQAEVSAAILADMNFPTIFQRLIHDYPQPQNSGVAEGSREWKLMNLLHVASLIADVCLADKNGQIKLAKKLKAEVVQLAIEESFIIEVAEKCAHDWPEWAALLNMGTRQFPTLAALFEQISNEPVEIVSPQAVIVPSGYKMRVLVVDDDRAMRMFLEKMLKDSGHHVATASNGVEALKMLKKERPQLIVTDWVMPEMDGIDLCRELRAQAEYRSIYVIVMTAYESAEILVEAFESGADDYVYKPITPKMFLARLRAAQRVVQLQEENAFDREQLLNYSKELAAANQRLQQQALTDELSGLPNRRFAMDRLEQEWALAHRGTRSLSCLMVDVDHFKSINDRFGHQIGDEALRSVANTLRHAARTQDVVCRYGGEEFLVICPDTSLDAAYQCAERLRLSVATHPLKLPDGNELKMTVSIGLARNSDSINSLQAILARADHNLYAAKAAGRNRTVAER